MKRILFILKSRFVFLLRLAFSFINGGNNCLICNKTVFSKPLCNKCVQLHFNCDIALSKERCSCCGKELNGIKNLCTQCRSEPLIKNADKVIPLFSYRLWNKELLFEWKINNVRSLSFFIADFFAQVLRKEKIEYIVPIPPRPGKIKENGWDQIDEICKILKYQYGFKLLNLLVRHNKQQQKKLDRKGRLDSIGKAYSLVDEKKLEKELRGIELTKLKVCLIDDVCTTGSTLECCAALLKGLEIGFVEAVTLFTVD